jgi:hypothetical protein
MTEWSPSEIPTEVGDMTHLRYKWTILYVTVVVTLIVILQVLEALGVVR